MVKLAILSRGPGSKPGLYLCNVLNCFSFQQFTESAESFTLTLSNPSGGAVLGTESTCTIVIVENDYPIYFFGNAIHIYMWSFDFKMKSIKSII